VVGLAPTLCSNSEIGAAAEQASDFGSSKLSQNDLKHAHPLHMPKNDSTCRQISWLASCFIAMWSNALKSPDTSSASCESKLYQDSPTVSFFARAKSDNS
jgi:hypothetical protein